MNSALIGDRYRSTVLTNGKTCRTAGPAVAGGNRNRTPRSAADAAGSAGSAGASHGACARALGAGAAVTAAGAGAATAAGAAAPAAAAAPRRAGRRAPAPACRSRRRTPPAVPGMKLGAELSRASSSARDATEARAPAPTAESGLANDLHSSKPLFTRWSGWRDRPWCGKA